MPAPARFHFAVLFAVSLSCTNGDEKTSAGSPDASVSSDGAIEGAAGPDVAAPESTAGATINVIKGSLPRYHTQNGVARNDLSGAAFVPAAKSLVLVDDGGDAPPDIVPFYLADVGASFKVTELPHDLMNRHGDLEGATFDGTYVYVVSSMSAELKDDRFHTLSRFKLASGAITDAATISPRAALMAALQTFDAALFERTKNLDGRAGGLNIEGITTTPTRGELIIGLRSPHAGATFPEKTRSGEAILVTIDATTFQPVDLKPRVQTIDLGGLGVRAIEYSQTAQGYFILAGIVEAGADYDFFFWKGPGSAPVRVMSDDFKALCRPEAVTELELGGKKHLFVASEESNALCDGQKFNYFLVELNPAFLATLK